MILVGDVDKQIWYQILGSISEFNIGLVRFLAESFEMLSDPLQQQMHFLSDI